MKINENITSADFKGRAKESLKGTYWRAVGITLLALLIMGGGLGFSFNFGTKQDISINGTEINFDTVLTDENISIIAGFLATVITIILAISVVHFIFLGVTQMGLARYNVKLCLGEKGLLKDIFAYYKTSIGKAALVTLLVYLFIWIWSFVLMSVMAITVVIVIIYTFNSIATVGIVSLVIIGFMVATFAICFAIYYRYALVYYILADDESLKPREAIKRSKELMKGNKWKMFCLDMSFIGWIILGALAFGVGSYFVMPYMNCAKAHFYCEVVGKQKTVEIDENAQAFDYALENEADANDVV